MTALADKELNYVYGNFESVITDFDRVIKRPVASKYGEGLFNQLQRADGKMFNVSTVLSLYNTPHFNTGLDLTQPCLALRYFYHEIFQRNYKKMKWSFS